MMHLASRESQLTTSRVHFLQQKCQLSADHATGLYGAPPTDKRLSPLLFDSHAGIAEKAYFAICGWDPRRDEAILLDQLLQEAGLSTKSHIYSGLPHGFWTTCPDLPVSKEWLQDLLQGVRWLLE
jgi:acetyl esterase/lipase